MMRRNLPPAVARAATTDLPAPPIRRRYPRVAVDLPAQYTIAGGSGWNECMIDDLSGGGVRIETRADIAAGTTLALRFIVDGTPITLTGRVAMSLHDRSRDRFIHGVAFTVIDPHDRQTIIDRVLAFGGGEPA